MPGKIKKTSTYRFNLPEGADASTLKPEDGVLQRVVENDTRLNKPLKEIQYGSDGIEEQLTVYEYDEKGFLTREVLLDGEGEILEEKTFEPDSQLRIQKALQHYADGSHDVTTYTRDENGRLIKELTVDDEGEQESLIEYSYQENHLVREVSFGEADELLWEKSYHYSEGDMLIEMIHKDHTEGLETRKTYEHDEHGHLREMLTYIDDELTERFLFESDKEGRPLQIIEENKGKKNKIEMGYDNRGNMVSQTEYNLQGEMINCVSRQYDKEGNLQESRITALNPLLGVNQYYIVRHIHEWEEDRTNPVGS
jgi:YD repeat-containing protein